MCNFEDCMDLSICGYFFKWPGHKLFEAQIDCMCMISLGEYKIKNTDQELFKICSKWIIIHYLKKTKTIAY